MSSGQDNISTVLQRETFYCNKKEKFIKWRIFFLIPGEKMMTRRVRKENDDDSEEER